MVVSQIVVRISEPWEEITRQEWILEIIETLPSHLNLLNW